MREPKSTEAQHHRMVEMLAKKGVVIYSETTPVKLDLTHMALGIAGEAGELVDAIKKCTIYNKELDRANVIEELGDLEFYMRHLRNILDISRNETLRHNMDKLAERYKNYVYTDKQAHDRADKNNSQGSVPNSASGGKNNS